LEKRSPPFNAADAWGGKKSKMRDEVRGAKWKNMKEGDRKQARSVPCLEEGKEKGGGMKGRHESLGDAR